MHALEPKLSTIDDISDGVYRANNNRETAIRVLTTNRLTA